MSLQRAEVCSVSTVVILHHREKEHAKARPGLVAVLLRPLLVFTLAGIDGFGFGPCRGRRGGLLPVDSESEVSICGGSSAHAGLDRRTAVLAQALLLLQRPGDLLPVQFDVRSVLRADGRPGHVLAAEAAAVPLAADSQDEGVFARRRPRALGLVFGDHFPLEGLRGDGLCLTARLWPRSVPVLSSVHPSSPPSGAFLTAAQHQLMGDASQDQQDGDVGEESHDASRAQAGRGETQI